MKERSSFTSRIGFVLAAAGSAVGLGNMWRFPYLAAKYGGGAFLDHIRSSGCDLWIYAYDHRGCHGKKDPHVMHRSF